ncbi:MAG: 23S rRNA (pseudouridine(1915)-N(3))-methyltransferase RlmH [Fusobacteriaceae bacterium]|nr:23S rRNA (pseudouridine(1915)-N(3))-methyltransferase RlmH [Fusobacteriaceae bacterium]
MTITLLCVGKLKEDYLTAGCREYLKRLSPWADVRILEIKEESGADTKALTVEKESAAVLGQLAKLKGYTILLAIGGESLSSEEFAGKLEALATEGKGRLVFVIGGSDGLSPEVAARADYALSFSRMTFPHQLMRLILLEQLYRGFSILHHGKYHK